MVGDPFVLKSIQILRDLLNVFIENGRMSKYAFRRFQIELSYNEKIYQGIKPKDARRLTAEEFFLSEKQIEKVIYCKK